MLLHRLNSGRPSYSPTTADTILHTVFKGSDRNPPLEAPWSAIPEPTTQDKPRELSPKARTTCLVPTSGRKPINSQFSRIPVFPIPTTGVSFLAPNPCIGAIPRTRLVFSATNPCMSAFSRTSFQFSAANPCRGMFSRTSLVFSAANPCIGAVSRISPSFPASNPCRGAIPRTSLHFSATNLCRGAISRTRLSISVCEGEL